MGSVSPVRRGMAPYDLSTRANPATSPCSDRHLSLSGKPDPFSNLAHRGFQRHLGASGHPSFQNRASPGFHTHFISVVASPPLKQSKRNSRKALLALTAAAHFTALAVHRRLVNLGIHLHVSLD